MPDHTIPLVGPVNSGGWSNQFCRSSYLDERAKNEYILKKTLKVKDLHAKFPALKQANIAQEFTLLATSPEVPTHDADLSGISDPAKRALETIISTVQSLVDKSQHTNPINTTTIFPLCPQQQSPQPKQIPRVLVANQPEASVMING